MQGEGVTVHNTKSCCSYQSSGGVLSPITDADDGFAESSDFSSHCSLTRCCVTDNEAVAVSGRKRRRGVSDVDSDDRENLPAVGHTLTHVVSPACCVGPETPTSSKQTVKRARECLELSCSQDSIRPVQRHAGGRRLVRCNSEAVVYQALSTSEQHSDLIGDFSRPHSLPLLTSAKHQDLKSISPDTVSSLDISTIVFCMKNVH